MMRSAEATKNFPYLAGTVCYIEIDNSGKVIQIDNNFTGIFDAYQNVSNGKSKIYAVWPGNFKSDLFEIDDLYALADAYGVPRPDEHVHEME